MLFTGYHIEVDSYDSDTTTTRSSIKRRYYVRLIGNTLNSTTHISTPVQNRGLRVTDG